MTTKRFTDNPQLTALGGTEILPGTSVDGGTDTASNPVAAGSDVAISVRQLLGLGSKVHAVALSGGTATVDCGYGLYCNHVLTLTANATLALSNLAPAGHATEGEIRIAQDATGGWTLTLPTAFKALGGSDTAIASGANKVTVLSFKTFNDGSTIEYAMQESA